MSLSSAAILAYYLDKLKYRWPGYITIKTWREGALYYY